MVVTEEKKTEAIQAKHFWIVYLIVMLHTFQHFKKNEVSF